MSTDSGDALTLFETDDSLTRQPTIPANHLVGFLETIVGIGPKGADALRRRGVETWLDIVNSPGLIPRSHRSRIVSDANVALNALYSSNVSFFAVRLPPREHWRIAATFPDKTMYLDIETTGLSRHYHRLTVIGWSRAEAFHAIVGDPTGAQIDELHQALSQSVVVTYNGAHFDLPFLRHHLPTLARPLAHVDLRHLGQRIGLTGGQKKVEATLGLVRNSHLRDLSGAAAPALWFRYLRGDLGALRLLVEYNHADVEGLALLLHTMTGLLEPGRGIQGRSSSFPDWLGRTGPTGGRAGIVHASRYHGPALTIKDVPRAQKLRVVGIDLSGGPKSITGWALVEGSAASTLALRTDEEIIDQTLRISPDVVSIDAPLGLPIGRTRVSDDDPARAEFGITRVSERELRRRGVNTYPALIRSMQALTARGMRLANLFRELGIPVIESFPGAMQDILGMPRKGLSLEALRLSLEDYGLAGDFTAVATTHDEIDALSSAIVAQLFWEGKIEALGNRQEGYLIVPDLEAERLNQHVIGISGKTASGKSTLGALLQRLGYVEISYSKVLGSLFPNPHGPTDRAYLRELGRKLHDERGQRWISEQVADAAGTTPKVVIDGVRYLADRSHLIERFGSSYEDVYLDAPAEIRRQRFDLRMDRTDDFQTAERDPTEQQVHLLRDKVSRTFNNGGPLYRLNMLADELALTSQGG